MAPLSKDSIQQFMQDGYVVLHEAFDRALAPKVAALAFDELGIDPKDRSTWQKPRHLIQRSFQGDDLDELKNSRIRAAIDQLCGPHPWRGLHGTGYVLVNLPGYDESPWGPVGGGHIDGIHFHHHVNSPEQSLVGLFLFTDVEQHGGGTWIRPGSHRVVSRILQDAEPDGLPGGELSRRADEATSDLPIAEVTGRAGDMLLMHPHLFHGSSKNCGSSIRVASNVCIAVESPMQFDRSPPDTHSVVEETIRYAVSPGVAE